LVPNTSKSLQTALLAAANLEDAKFALGEQTFSKEACPIYPAEAKDKSFQHTRTELESK
jgi:hypothetical protein